MAVLIRVIVSSFGMAMARLPIMPVLRLAILNIFAFHLLGFQSFETHKFYVVMILSLTRLANHFLQIALYFVSITVVVTISGIEIAMGLRSVPILYV